MALFDKFKKKAPAPPPPPPKPAQDAEDVSVYSHMRVEVTTKDGQMLFVAKLMYPQRHTAELHQYSEAENSLLENCSEAEALPVHIRGYHDRLRKAVYMEGFITPQPKHIWLVSHLYVARVGNDRAFFRLDTDLEANITKFGGRNAGEFPCRLRNISVGGASIGSEQRYYKGDTFLLKAKLAEESPAVVLYCEVLRVTERNENWFEYGCRFLELTETEQEQITQDIANMKGDD